MQNDFKEALKRGTEQFALLNETFCRKIINDLCGTKLLTIFNDDYKTAIIFLMTPSIRLDGKRPVDELFDGDFFLDDIVKAAELFYEHGCK